MEYTAYNNQGGLLNYVCQELRPFHPQLRKAGSTLQASRRTVTANKTK